MTETEYVVDEYADNPLVSEAEATRPHIYAAAMTEAEPPTLFVTGDLPPFTASGLNPEVLRRFPYTSRHAAATEPDPAKVLSMLEQHSTNPMAEFRHQGLDEYRDRVRRWLGGIGAGQQPNEEIDEAIYDSLFGDEERHRQEQDNVLQQIAELEKESADRMAELRKRAGL